MTLLTDPTLREAFQTWKAWSTLTAFLFTGCDPVDVDPAVLYISASDTDRSRLVALLYAHCDGETLEEAGEILDDVLMLAGEGRRPRFGRELGLVFGAQA